MRHLILKLDGVMQAWGGHTYEDYRPTELFPTRSGLVGLLAACVGIERNEYERLQSLAKSLTFTVRAESRNASACSTRILDFHTVQNARKVDGSEREAPIVSKRQYLCDSVFTVAVGQTSNAEFGLEAIAAAVKRPVFTPFLGRRSCPLSRPLFETWIDAENGIEAIRAYGGTEGVIYSEEMCESGVPLRVRDVPLYGRIRQFGARTIYVHAKG